MLCDGVVDCPDRSDEGVFCCKFMILVQSLNAMIELVSAVYIVKGFIWNFVGKFL
jgi:hypothetical protein